MGGATEKQMVAIVCVVFIGLNASAQTTTQETSTTQQPTTKLRLFKPQVGFGGSGAQGSTTRATAFPGGPSTEPAGARARENKWVPNMALPSTDPVPPGGNIRTVSGTQDPDSPESRLAAKLRRDAELARLQNQQDLLAQQEADARARGMALPQDVGTRGGAALSGVFGDGRGQANNENLIKAPKDISLPQQDLGRTDSGSLAGLFESAGNAVSGGAGLNQGAAGTRNDLGYGTNQAGASASGTGTPFPPSVIQNLPLNWTPQHLEELVSMFGIQRNDPRLQDENYLNYLHNEFMKQRETEFMKQREAQSRMASRDAANTRTATGSFGLPSTATGNLASSAAGAFNTNNAALGTNTQGLLDGYGTSRQAQTPTNGGLLTNPNGSQYSGSFRDPMALASERANGGVQAATQTPTMEERLTARLLEEREKRAQAEARANLLANQVNPNPYYQQNGRGVYPGTIYPGGMVPNQPINGANYTPPGFTPQGQMLQGQGQQTQTQHPPQAPPNNQIAQSQDAPASPSDGFEAPDHAAIGATPEVRNFIPLVNIALLCSIGFNLFLWKHMQTLRYNYRDITVANRLSANDFAD